MPRVQWEIGNAGAPPEHWPTKWAEMETAIKSILAARCPNWSGVVVRLWAPPIPPHEQRWQVRDVEANQGSGPEREAVRAAIEDALLGYPIEPVPRPTMPPIHFSEYDTSTADERANLTELVRIVWDREKWTFTPTFERTTTGWCVVRALHHPMTVVGGSHHAPQDVRHKVVAALSKESGMTFEV